MEHDTSQTPTETIVKAMEHAEQMGSVLIIYSGKDGFKSGSFDSDMTLAESIYLLELYKAWLMHAALSLTDSDDEEKI